MPITAAQKKSVRKTQKRRVLNRKFKDDLKIASDFFRKKIEKEEKLEQKDLDAVYAAIDKAKKKKIFHRKTAARMKSKAARQYNNATAGEKSSAPAKKAVAKKAPAKKAAPKKTTSTSKTTKKAS